MNCKIQKKEDEAFKDLVSIISKLCPKCKVEPTEYGTHYDAVVSTRTGEKEYVELKRRTCTIDQYKDATALNVYKANYLKKIQDEEGVKVVWMQLYPKSGKYIVMPLDDIFKEGWVTTSTKKKVEMEEDSPMIEVQEWHVNLNPDYIYSYTSTLS